MHYARITLSWSRKSLSGGAKLVSRSRRVDLTRRDRQTTGKLQNTLKCEVQRVKNIAITAWNMATAKQTLGSQQHGYQCDRRQPP
jgi:hypothetical protein